MATLRPQITESRTRYTFRPGTQTLPFAVAPRVLNRAHSITADVDIPTSGAEGVLLCQGAGTGGWTFYLHGRRLHYALRVRTHRHTGHRPGQGFPEAAPSSTSTATPVGQTAMPVTTPVAFN